MEVFLAACSDRPWRSELLLFKGFRMKQWFFHIGACVDRLRRSESMMVVMIMVDGAWLVGCWVNWLVEWGRRIGMEKKQLCT